MQIEPVTMAMGMPPLDELGNSVVTPEDNKDAVDRDCLLTKEELIALNEKEPIWRRLRIGLIALFWIMWLSLIAASIVYIVFTPKCPPRPVQNFWESKVGYWINPFAFKDSNKDLVGDLQGLVKAVDYIEKEVGAGFLILTSFTPNFPRKLQNNGTLSFNKIHPSLGSMEDFQAVVRTFKNRGIEVVVSLNFNSVSLKHTLAKPEFLKKALPSDKFSRAGTGYTEVIDGQPYYSTYGTGSAFVDLDLTNNYTMEEIKNATRFWLTNGADGVLLDDAAFFVEQNGCTSDGWFSDYPYCKLFTPGSASVIQQLRTVVDEVAATTSRSRALLVDPGNTGYPPSSNKLADRYFGTPESPGAHLMITRHFTFMRGGVVRRNMPTLSGYIYTTNKTLLHNYGLITASPSDKPHRNLFSTASMFLLPGTPIIFAGSELAWEPACVQPPSQLYPFGETPIIDDVTSYLPMPWDDSGEAFSESFVNSTDGVFRIFIKNCNVRETVESSLAAGRGPSMFNLTTSLVKLYANTPALQWGQVDLNTNVTNSWTVDIFKRYAEGFDSIFVVLKRSRNDATVLDFSKHCIKITPILSYPSKNKLFPTNIEFPSTKVYIGDDPEEALYIFRCVA